MTREELQSALKEGEGYRTEFKESAQFIDKELVAFANSEGGRIFIGITDSNKIKGITITNSLKSQIQNTANKCQPPVKFSFEKLDNMPIPLTHQGTICSRSLNSADDRLSLGY